MKKGVYKRINFVNALFLCSSTELARILQYHTLFP